MAKTLQKVPEANGSPGKGSSSMMPMLGSVDVWLAVEAVVDAVPAAEVIALRVDLQAAAEKAIAVVGGASEDAALVRSFAAVAAAGLIDPDVMKKVERYGSAAWHARHQQMQAEQGRSLGTVSEAVMQRAEELFARMQKVGVYYFGDDDVEGSIVAAMNASPGHRKMANQLIALADLYKRNPAVVSADKRHYRTTDERDARKTAASIIAELSDDGTTSVALWTSRCARVWTLLALSYAEMQSLARWLLRATPDAAAERFPSLVSEARSAATPRKAEADPVVTPTPANGEAPVAAAPKRKRKSKR